MVACSAGMFRIYAGIFLACWRGIVPNVRSYSLFL